VFTDFFSVDDHLWRINGCPSTGPDSRFINDSTSLTVYKTTEGGDAKLFVNQYDHTLNSSTGLVNVFDINSSNLSVKYPQIAVKDNVFGIVWEGQADVKDIFINYSEYGVAELNSANAYNVTNATGSQVKPDIALSNTKFHIVYADLSSFNLKYLFLESTTSLNEVKTINQMNLDIYPNPTTDFVSVKLKTKNRNKIDVKITNYLGQDVFNVELLSEKEYNGSVDTKKWTSGVYYISVESNDDIITKTIIKK